MSKKTATNKGTPATAQAAPEAVPTAAAVTETLTPNEQEFLQAVRRGKGIQAERQAERAARIDAAAEKLKALESDEDLDKALDFIGRITGTGGHYLSPRGETPAYAFYQLSLHLAMAMWSEWFNADELFVVGESGENEKADLTQFVPWMNEQIVEAFDAAKVDPACMLEWINSTHYHSAEWIDERGVQVWLGECNFKAWSEHAARVAVDE